MNKTFIIIVSFILVLIFTAFYLLPRYNVLRELQKEIEIKEINLLTREEGIRELQNLKEKLKIYEEQIAKIDSALPADADLPALFDFVQKTASQSGLVLKSVSHSSARPLDDFVGLEETGVSLTLSGSYNSLKNFISVLETTARLIEAQSVSFSSDPEDGPKEYELTLKIYSYKD